MTGLGQGYIWSITGDIFHHLLDSFITLKYSQCIWRRSNKSRLIQRRRGNHKRIPLLLLAVHSQPTQIPQLSNRHSEKAQTVCMKSYTMLASTHSNLTVKLTEILHTTD
jgi:hypothetical protein